MEYARAVWKEGPRVMEDTILRQWIKNNYVYWPVGISAMQALREKREPTEDWKMFKLIKIKVESGKSNQCIFLSVFSQIVSEYFHILGIISFVVLDEWEVCDQYVVTSESEIDSRTIGENMLHENISLVYLLIQLFNKFLLFSLFPWIRWIPHTINL